MPQLYLFLKVIPHRSILNLFYQDELDLLFGFQDDIPIKNDTIYKELFRIPLCCIVPAAHPYAARSELAKEELYLENIVVCNSFKRQRGSVLWCLFLKELTKPSSEKIYFYCDKYALPLMADSNT